MRVVVTGATGNVGSRLLEVLAAEPGIDSLVGLSRRMPGELPRGVDWRQVDVAAELPRDVLDGADAVVHLAWLFQPTHQPTTTWQANVEGTARVLGAVSGSRARILVHASSVGAYSPRQDHRLVDESWPTHSVPTAAYSREKAYVERLLDVFEATHPSVRVVRLRPAFTFRREASVQQRRLFLGPFAPTRTLSRMRLPVLPDPGGLSFQAVHTDDVVEAYRLALLREAAGAFNVASDPVLDMSVVADVLGARAVRVSRRLTRAALLGAWGAHLLPASPGLLDLICQLPLMDTRRIRYELGWRPAHSSRKALEALVEGFRSAEGAPTPPLGPASSGRFRSHELATGVGSRP